MSFSPAPFVSIVITSFNYAHYLEECLQSCLFQPDTKSAFEVLVIDDGSTDNTRLVLEKYDDEHLRKFHIENSGIEKASNFGFKKARGEFVVRVDADDRLHPSYLSTLEPYLTRQNLFYYPDYLTIDNMGAVTKEVRLPDYDRSEIFQRGDFLATGTIYPSSLISVLGGYNTQKINSGLENYELVLELITQGYEGLHVPEILFDYRRHGGNISVKRREDIIQNGRSLFSDKKLGTFRTNSYHPYELQLALE